MMENNKSERSLLKVREELESNLKDNILSFWMMKMVDKTGGFHGRIDGENRLHPEAVRGAVLNSRILWTFAAAYRLTGREPYLETALWARDYLIDNFFDPPYGGMFWSINPDGTPADDKVQFYSLGFAIYGFSELARATGDTLAYSLSRRLFNDIERNGHDDQFGGYFEATKRDWTPIDDMRLSGKDMNAPKTMNTHLHILEPYTNLMRIWGDRKLKERVRELIEIFLDKIIDPATGHLGLFFDREWNRVDHQISYGHDIEAAWLLLEAAEELGDQELLERTKTASLRLLEAASEGLNDDGSMSYEIREDGTRDDDRHWWVQAENVTARLWLASHLNMPQLIPQAIKGWDYIKENLVDPEGEWYWSRKGDGSVNRTDDKAGFWKCPYHNSRMCLEGMEILKGETSCKEESK